MKVIITILLFLSFSVQAQRILIIGDSLTEGYGVEKKSSYPSLLETLIKQTGKDVVVINAGSSGSTSAGAFKRLRWHLKKKPQILILALGGNDGLRGVKIEATQKNLQKAIDLAKSKSLKIFLAGMKLPYNYGKDYRKKFERMYHQLAKKNQVQLIPFLLKGVGGVKELNLADGIHPNEKGHKKIAQTVYQFIKGHL